MQDRKSHTNPLVGVHNQERFTMNNTITALIATASFTAAASAGIAYTVDFDDQPLGPSTYAAAGPEQILDYAGGQIQFSGGVVLGFPTAFPAVDFATEPNVYASSSTGDPSLNPTVAIDINLAGAGASLVQGLLFNGEVQANDFIVTAYDLSGAVVDTAMYNIPSNLDSGAVVFSMSSDMDNIYRVEFQEYNTDGAWNMLFDTITFNREIPAPGSILSIAGLGLIASRRRRA